VDDTLSVRQGELEQLDGGLDAIDLGKALGPEGGEEIAVFAQAAAAADEAAAERLGRGLWNSPGLLAAWAPADPLVSQGRRCPDCMFPGREGGT
jgi:hypothetical protein